MNNEQNVERNQSVSRQLLSLLLSPGGAREPIIRVEEVSRILGLSGQSELSRTESARNEAQASVIIER
jgi:hypothetical protein